MAVIKNKMRKNFTMVSNDALRDKMLSMKERGVFCTLCSLSDGWEFSVAGLSAIVPDGVDAIRASIVNLEKMGYIKRTKSRDENGKFISEIEIFNKRSTTDLPSQLTRDGKSVAENPVQYYTNRDKMDKIKSIHQSDDITQNDGQTDISIYKTLIADNIKLDWLLEVASRHGGAEVQMVNEIYDVICDMVCCPREKVVIRGVSYPWATVQSQFLKLTYQHIADVLNRIIDADLKIKNMSAYLVTVLYTQSLVGTIEAQAKLHDEYLKYLRGEPY